LYHYQTYAAAGTTTQYSFFQTSVGTGGLTYADTNMEVASALPAPKAFLVTEIYCVIFPGVVPSVFGAQAVAAGVNDIWTIGKAGYVRVFIGSRDYTIEAPIARFPQPMALQGFAAASDGGANAVTTQQLRIANATWIGKPYNMKPYVLLESTMNFNVSWHFPATTAVSADARIGTILGGFLYRSG
jgi:hypothetical protein